MSSASTETEPVAIVGIACRFPGASSVLELGDLLSDPPDLSREIPKERFSIDGFYNLNPQAHGNTNVRKSYFLRENVRNFDNGFFNITAMEALAMDPQQRLLLETTYEALENANIPVGQLKGSDTAVYVGLMCGDYENRLMGDIDSAPRYQATGVGRSIMANRISYTWDLRGPSMTIDTACSSSLVALHQAVQALRLQETQLAIVGGSNLLLGPEWYITESNLNMLSPTGKSRMWDADADGYARGDGVAAVVLKRLSDAIADGDYIECVIRETGVSQDGRTNGITTPSAESQASLIRRVYAKSGLDPIRDGCQYFEAHGTGTPAGDPIEAKAISSVFGGGTEQEKRHVNPLYVGSVKTVIGHTEGTAGLAGVIKATVALQRKTIFPNKHFNKLNPQIEQFYRNLMVPTTALPWPTLPDGQPRRASVNSFGFGGTNSHAIIESFENEHLTFNERGKEPPVFTPFILSATSESSLYGGLEDYRRWLDGHLDVSLHDMLVSMYHKSSFAYRTSVSASSPAELSSKLSEKCRDRQAVAPAQKPPKVLGIFTGQGAQFPGMMSEILQHSLWARKRAHELEEALMSLIPPSASDTMKAALSQPLCTLTQIILVDILLEAGVCFGAVVGHSSGEIAAAYAAGYITAECALAAAYYRGLHTNLAGITTGQQGAMLAVSMSYADASLFCAQSRFKDRLCVAASNSPNSVTLSGDQDAIIEAEQDLRARSLNPKRLSVDKAYHSHHMYPCSTAYLNSLRSLPGFTPDPKTVTPWFSSVNVQEASNLQLSMDYWNDNLVHPVLFSPALEKACHNAGPFNLVLEVGPHPALRAPVLQTLLSVWPDIDVPYASLLRRGEESIHTMRNGLGQLWEAGLDLNLAKVNQLMSGVAGKALQRLPTYHWGYEMEHWHESRYAKTFRTRQHPTHPLLGNPLPDSNDLDMRWRNILLESEMPWLAGHKVQGQTIFPAAGILCMAIEAARKMHPQVQVVQKIEITDLKILQALLIPQDSRGVETICTMTEVRRNSSTQTAATFSLYSTSGDNLSLVARCAVALQVDSSPIDFHPLVDRKHLLMNSIDSQRLYDAWGNLGYGYTGCFRAIKNAERKLSAARGSISPTTDGKMLLHPATLDAAIQTILLAYCHPEDGRLSTIHVPKVIKKLRMNATLALPLSKVSQDLQFDTLIPDREEAGLCGDVDLYTQKGERLLQIEGLQCTPLSPATAENDVKLFYSTAWAPASPNAPAVCWDGRATEADFKLSEDLERLSFYYMTQLEKAVPKSHPQRQHGTWNLYFRFLAHVRKLVESGVHPYVKSEWLQDTFEVAAEIKTRYPESLDRKVIEAVGENVAQVVLSGGAGTGSATKTIFEEIGSTFGTYTFTDISIGFFEKARDVFSDYVEKMNFMKLDAECDVVAQGFEAHSYDLVVASLVLHATSNLENTLSNARRLLKPGGYLIMLEITDNDPIRLGFVFGTLPQWWIGDAEGRSLSPCVGPMEWDSLLQRCGFSKIDSITPDLDRLPFPLSVISAQATDDRMQLLRNPLTNMSVFPQLVIVGGATAATAQLVIKVYEGLETHYRAVRCIQTFDDFSKEQHSGSTILSLADLDGPVIENITDKRLGALKDILACCNMAVWITQNAKDACPGANMTIGFFRTALWESPESRLRSIDFVDGSMPDALVISENLLEYEAAIQLSRESSASQPLWSLERELIYKEGHLLIPRLVANRALDDRYNASRRPIARKNGVDSVRLSPHGWLEQDALYAFDKGVSSHSKFVNLKVEYSTAFPVPVRRRGAGLFQAYIVFGKLVGSENLVLALARSCSSTVRVSQCSVLRVAEDCIPSLLLTQMASILQATYLLDFVDDNQRLLLHNPSKELISAVTSLAKSRSIRTITTSTSLEEGAIYLPQSLPKRILRAKLGKAIDYFVDLSMPGRFDDSVSATIRECLSPSTCIIDSRPILGVGGQSRGVTPDNKNDDFNPSYDVVSLSRQLEDAYQLAHCIPTSPLDVISLRSFGEDRINLDRKIIQWGGIHNAMARVVPTYSQVYIKPDRTYWLLGLTGSLGLSLSEWLIGKGARNLVLSSRNPDVDSNWIMAMNDEKDATVTVIPCDATKKTSLAAAYKQIKESLPPIAGIAQGAMVLDDASIRDMDADKMAKVARPKVNGSLNLNKILIENDEQLDFLVLFSSIAAVFGSHGQSNYTAANSFVRSLALQRRQLGNPASVLNLGRVVGVGYASDKLSQAQREKLQKNGFRGISEDDFHHAFAEAILASPCHSNMDHEITIGAERFPAHSPTKPLWADDPRLSHLIIHGPIETFSGKGNNNNSQQTPREKLMSATSVTEAKDAIKSSFLEKLQSILSLSATQMEKESALLSSSTSQLGFDSLIAVEVRSWFLKALDISISTLEIMGGITIMGIIDLALSKVNKKIVPRLEMASLGAEDQKTPESSTFTSSSISSPASDSSKQTSDFDPDDDVDARRAHSISPTYSDDNDFEQDLDRYPLSFGQEMFWFVHTLMSDPTTLNNTVAYQLTGSLNVNKLSIAVQTVAERHGGLRTAIQESNGGLVTQVMMKTPLMHLEEVFASVDEVPAIIEDLAGYTYQLHRGETIRIVLVSSSPTEHHLLLGFHHINMDGISLQVILAELEAIYRGEALSEHPLQYLDFARRQRLRADTGEWSDTLHFWETELSDLSGELPIMQLPNAANGRRPLTEYRTIEIDSRVEPSVFAMVREKCRQLGVTHFCFYLTVFRIMLARMAKVDDFCIGIADGNRLDDDSLDSIGMYLNLLPLRFKSTHQHKFGDVASDTRKKTQEAMAHSGIPFGLLLSKLGVARSAEYSPVFQAFVDYRQGAQETQRFGDCVLDVCYYQGARAAYDVSLDIIDSKNSQTFIRLAVQESLYSKADCGLLMKSYMHLVESFAQPNAENVEIDSASLFSFDSLKNMSLVKGDIKTTRWPATLAQRVAEISINHADSVAINGGDGTILTYREMSDRIAAIKSGILGLGVSRGSVVGVFQEPTADWVCSLLAIWQAGCVYLPLDLASPMTRLQSNVLHCGPSLVLVDSLSLEAAESFKTAVLDVSSCKDVNTSPKAAPSTLHTKPEDPAAILYTSGSTGTPKGIVLSHQNLVHEVEFSSISYDFEKERVLCQSALTFDMSLTQIFTAIAYGGSLHMVPRAHRGDAAFITRLMGRHGITFTGATPSEYLSWTNFAGTDLGRSSWRRAVCGGEQVTSSLLSAFASLGTPRLKVYNAYGPTETTCSATRWELPYQDLASKPAGSRIPAGFPAPNCSICIVDENLLPLPIGMPGEILVGGPKVAVGYLENSSLTQEKFFQHKNIPKEFEAQGWTSAHRTGDVGRILPDGQLIVEGRIAGDTQIKIRGNRADLVDIEDAILRAGEGRLAETVVFHHKALEQREGSSVSDMLVALAVFDENFPEHLRQDFLHSVLQRASLPRPLKPGIIRPVASIPKSVSGKIDRVAAEKGFGTHFQLQASTSEQNDAWSEIELRLRHVWLQVLPSSSDALVLRSSDFFHVGGNSLLLVVLQKKLGEILGVHLPLVALFDSSTLDKMALLVDQKFVEQGQIDWEMETDPENILSGNLLQRTDKTPQQNKSTMSVVLTGATGLLGKALLHVLNRDERVSTIYCVAVRKKDTLEPFMASGKVQVYEGDLTAPRLGLSDSAVQRVFSDADAIIHNGADVSHMKSYRSIKSANFGSTVELVRQALSFRRQIPFHFVSTAGVSLYTGLETFHEISAAPFPPPTDNSDGYTASKWASERFLERVSERTGLPVWVHRPSNIHRVEDPQFDLFQNLLKYSRLLQAVPVFPSLQGQLNLVEAGDIAQKLVHEVMEGPAQGIVYRHQIGRRNLSMEEMGEFIRSDPASKVQSLDVETWTAAAEQVGLQKTVSEWFKKVAFGAAVKYPLLVPDRKGS
nr:AMP-binding enzyme [Colletotrichum truncatum]KAF6784096.1 AMP-binding enzyme [Colletotrichum truncatum]